MAIAGQQVVTYYTIINPINALSSINPVSKFQRLLVVYQCRIMKFVCMNVVKSLWISPRVALTGFQPDITAPLWFVMHHNIGWYNTC